MNKKEEMAGWFVALVVLFAFIVIGFATFVAPKVNNARAQEEKSRKIGIAAELHNLDDGKYKVVAMFECPREAVVEKAGLGKRFFLKINQKFIPPTNLHTHLVIRNGRFCWFTDSQVKKNELCADMNPTKDPSFGVIPSGLR
ncbi:MAG: hypothetical protein ABH832_01395 [bacterium]